MLRHALCVVVFSALLVSGTVAHASVSKDSIGSSLLFEKVRVLLAPFFELLPFVSEPVDTEDITRRVNDAIRGCETSRTTTESAYECYRAASHELMSRFHFPDIVEASKAVPDCHDLMHHMAQEAYRTYGDLGKVFKAGDEFVCFGAVYHGGSEGYLIAHAKENTSEEKMTKHMLAACTDAVSDDPLGYSQCVHGIGHALMFVTSNELPRSLALCDAFPTEGERINCYGGAFMENVPASQLSPHVSVYAKEGDPWYPCRLVGDRYRNVCYTFQLSAVPSGTPEEQMQAMAELCGKAPPENQGACFLSYGSSVAGFIDSQEERVDHCLALSDTTQKKACIGGVVIFYLDRFATLPDKLAGALDFCARLPRAYQEECSARAGDIFHSVSAAERETLCARAGEWREACFAGVQTL